MPSVYARSGAVNERCFRASNIGTFAVEPSFIQRCLRCRKNIVAVHQIEPERRTLHGHWSPDLPPALHIEPGDTVVYRTLDASWSLEKPRGVTWEEWEARRRFAPLDAARDKGHALCGPVFVSGAQPGMALSVTFERIRPADWGWTFAGGWDSPTNRAQSVVEDYALMFWQINADAQTARNQQGHTVALRPFMGVSGVAPAEPGFHSTTPPRAVGGNMDCKELVEGTTLFLPIAVPGALFSVGDGHAVQGDGEVSGMAIECPMDEVRIKFDLVPTALTLPRAQTPTARVTLGFDKDLNKAAQSALRGMVGWIMETHALPRPEALALASVTADLRVTQIVNQVWGVHAVLPNGAIR